jgi:DNA-binding MarR family transcriptional regulator
MIKHTKTSSTTLGSALIQWHEGLSKRMRSQFSTFGREYGLSEGQIKWLIGLNHLGTLNVGSMSDTWGISPSAISQAMDKLIERGFVERFEATEDRRIKLHRLTENGIAVARQYHQAWDVLADEIAAFLGEGDAAEAARILESMAEALNAKTD